MDTKTCKKCRARVPINARFCNQCRHSDFYESIACTSCGTNIPYGINFCPSCGKKLNLSAKIKMKRVHAKNGNLHNCNICIQKIKYDLVVCPSCLNAFHFNHLANWILQSNSCPVCKVELELLD